MIGKKSAIKRYKKKLSPELVKRYGGKGPYTEEQVRATVNDLGLNHRFIHYAYFMYCGQQALIDQGIDPATADEMSTTIEKATAASFFAAPFDMIFGSGDGDGGGMDGGGMGGGGIGGDGV